MNKILEDNDLSCFAIQESWAKRQANEEISTHRKSFSKDRDRILYSKEFRRLSGKTQVFVVGFDDHHRTRLTHTLEVSQIATTICKNLGLNSELAEAIALGHDVGHTPFGHVGERFLNLLMNGCYDVRSFNSKLPENEKGFKHNWQSLRVVSSLEKHDREYEKGGLNLTNFTKWGILNHTKREYKECEFINISKSQTDESARIFQCGYMKKNLPCHGSGNFSNGFYDQYKEQLCESEDWSYEAFIVARADEIAQRHHDIEDGIEAGILKKNDLVDKINVLFDDLINDKDRDLISRINKEKDKNYYIPLISHFVVNLLVSNIIENSKIGLFELKQQNKIITSKDFANIRRNLNVVDEYNRIDYLGKFKFAEKELSNYLYEIIINSYLAQKMDGKSDYLLRQLSKAYITNPQQLPDGTVLTLFKNIIERIENMGKEDKKNITSKLANLKITIADLKKQETGLLRITLNKLHKSNLPIYEHALLRTVCDYLSGMTDQYATIQYGVLYGN